MATMSKFSVYPDSPNGFHITLDNGVTVSVQWHGGNYCRNRNESFNTTKPSPNAELAMWLEYHPGQPWVTSIIEPTLTDDEVIGWLSASQVAELMYKASKFNAAHWALSGEALFDED